MPFRPKNAPAFYTAMMQFLRADWTVLFNETKQTIKDRIIIDDLLFFSNHIPTLLHTFLALCRASFHKIAPFLYIK